MRLNMFNLDYVDAILQIGLFRKSFRASDTIFSRNNYGPEAAFQDCFDTCGLELPSER